MNFVPYVSAEPNAGHLALAALERQGKNVAIATQNVDCLHQKAGSHVLHKIHGTIDSISYMKCKRKFKASDFAEFFTAGDVPHWPECGKVLRPNLIFFSEEVPSEPMRLAKLAFLNSELVMILGS